MLFDLPLDQLREYRPELSKPVDFDAFWSRSLSENAGPVGAEFTFVESGLRTVDVFDVAFGGFGGDRVRAWMIMPRDRPDPLPCVVEYAGYGGGRGLPHERLVWSAAGYAHFVMDTRGQGSDGRVGTTGDGAYPTDPHTPGFLTLGAQSADTHYYRRIYVDAVHAVEAARQHPSVDGERMAVTGISQGGGVAVAVAGLVPDLAAMMADVPFLCHIRRATELTDAEPYGEISRYCRTHPDRVEEIFAVLSYFDAVNFAARATTTGLFSVALMDQICPPSTVYAAYNHYGGPKDIRVWPYHGHEGAEAFHLGEKLRWLADLLK